MGHRAGAKTLHEIVEACSDLGIRYLTVYAFSTENWQRPRSEVDGIMRLIARKAAAEQPGLMKNNVRVKMIGRLDDIPPASRAKLDELVATTAKNTGLTFTLAISYGGRAEIIDACRAAVAEGVAPATEDEFTALLYAPDHPDPDLLIRTGGDQRISNYLLWQLAYAEIYVTDALWPDFHRAELVEAVEEFGRRQRRFGHI